MRHEAGSKYGTLYPMDYGRAATVNIISGHSSVIGGGSGVIGGGSGITGATFLQVSIVESEISFGG